MASDVVTFLATFLSWSEASLLLEVIVWSPLFALINIYMYKPYYHYNVKYNMHGGWGGVGGGERWVKE